jgi:hypothetical protein
VAGDRIGRWSYLVGFLRQRPWTATIAGGASDADGDGFNDALEAALHKSDATFCPIMRSDVDYDGVVSILDLSAVARDFGAAATAREDQDNDGVVSILDILRQANVFMRPVTLCP